MTELASRLAAMLLAIAAELPADACRPQGAGTARLLPSAGQGLTPDLVATLLLDLHPDYNRYIGKIRYGRTRLRPASLYAGLVRSGGVDPRDPDDAPVRRRGATNDLIIYSDTWDASRSVAWLRLLADHEYFHARHLAGGAQVPLAGFENARADSDYLEATAWGHVLERAAAGAYGELAPREWTELRGHYRRHQERFRQFVMDRQPPAWAHYGRFLPDHPDSLSGASPAQKAGTAPSADPGREPGTR